MCIKCQNARVLGPSLRRGRP